MASPRGFPCGYHIELVRCLCGVWESYGERGNVDRPKCTGPAATDTATGLAHGGCVMRWVSVGLDYTGRAVTGTQWVRQALRHHGFGSHWVRHAWHSCGCCSWWMRRASRLVGLVHTGCIMRGVSVGLVHNGCVMSALPITVWYSHWMCRVCERIVLDAWHLASLCDSKSSVGSHCDNSNAPNVNSICLVHWWNTTNVNVTQCPQTHNSWYTQQEAGIKMQCMCIQCAPGPQRWNLGKTRDVNQPTGTPRMTHPVWTGPTDPRPRHAGFAPFTTVIYEWRVKCAGTGAHVAWSVDTIGDEADAQVRDSRQVRPDNLTTNCCDAVWITSHLCCSQ